MKKFAFLKKNEEPETYLDYEEGEEDADQIGLHIRIPDNQTQAGEGQNHRQDPSSFHRFPSRNHFDGDNHGREGEGDDGGQRSGYVIKGYI